MKTLGFSKITLNFTEILAREVLFRFNQQKQKTKQSKQYQEAVIRLQGRKQNLWSLFKASLPLVGAAGPKNCAFQQNSR